MSLLCVSAAGKAADVEKILAGMTTRQKVAQLIVPTVGSRASEKQLANYQMWIKEGVGGMIVMDGRLIPCIERINELQKQSSIPMVISIDGEWGASMRFPEFPYFPKQMQLGSLRKPDLVYEMGRAVGREMRLINVLVNYAPDVDININPKNPVINTRSFGEDREKVAVYGSAYARGMQDEGIIACAKHFPGHGDTQVDSHRGLPVLDFSRERLDSLELYPFQRCINDGIGMIMMGHLQVPALDPTGTVTSVSYPVVTELLKEQMGFQGLVVTDALGMDGVNDAFGGDGPQACLAAYKAGVDILLMPLNIIGCIDLMEAEYNAGRLPDLDQRVLKVLRMKEKLGLFEEGYSPIVNTEGLVEAADSQSDKDLINEISRQSQILVKGPKGKFRLRGRKTAYVALGYGEEKRIIPMDEAAGFNPEADGTENNAKPVKPEDDPNVAKEGGKGGPQDYGARRGIGASGAEIMAATLAKDAHADCYFLPRDFTLEELQELKSQLGGYKKIVLGFHDTDSRPQNNYGIKDPAIYDFIGEWTGESRKQKFYGVYCGSPYALDVMPWYQNFKAFIISFADNKYNCQAAADILTGKLKAQGVLPVRAGGHPAGYSASR